jgi:hypothetical protein
MRSRPILHGFLALGAVAVVGTFALRPWAPFEGSILPDAPSAGVADIAFEHASPLAAHIRMSALKGESLIEVSHEGKETILVSVPEDWRRTEVRNVPLQSVTEEPPMLGYRRWTLPEGASVTYYSKDSPVNLLIHNPGRVPLKVRGIRVDLDTETTLQEIVLVHDEPTLLW